MRSTTAGPSTDADIPAYLAAIEVPELVDVHVHFLPEPMLRKVWAYFDAARDHYGQPWPVQYRSDEPTRLATLRSFGVRRIPALTYPHKAGMARWLNEWNAQFAARVDGAIHCGTLYPEPDVGEYVAQALHAGARLFKVHVQVGDFAPDDPALEPAWELLERAGAPVVIHAGSAPLPGRYTGSQRIANVLRRHPELTLVIAHLGMPEYDEFADLALGYERVHLDTTMALTDFTEALAPTTTAYRARLAGLRDKIVLGSDFPNIPYPYAHQLAALARLELGDDWMRAVLCENGTRLLT